MVTAKNKKPAATPPAAKKAAKATKDKELKRHPLSEKYGPKLDEEEMQGMAADMKKHGQHEPIILYEGMVLAGWTRYCATKVAGIEPLTRQLPEGANPTDVAFGTNFMRRKLSSVQKAFFGAQYAVDSGEKQSDVAKQLACNLNRLNQCCQLLKMDTAEARDVIEKLRDTPDMSGAAFDELMKELGIAREPAPRANPARASAGGPLDGDDDLDLGDLDEDISGGAIDSLTDLDDDALNGDEASPPPAGKRKQGSKAGEGVGDDDPLPSVGAKRTTMRAQETAVSRIAKAFNGLDPVEQRKFVKFAWKKLRTALDAAIGGADVEYEPPATIKPDPSRIARNKPAETLDDGHKVSPKKKGSDKPTPTKKSTKAPAKKPAAKAPPPKRKGNGKAKHDQDI